MAVDRGFTHHERRIGHSGHLASGTLACPACDAPVAPGPLPLSPADPLACPFCARAGAVRDFLSLASPTRPARVEVRVYPASTRSSTQAQVRTGRQASAIRSSSAGDGEPPSP